MKEFDSIFPWFSTRAWYRKFQTWWRLIKIWFGTNHHDRIKLRIFRQWETWSCAPQISKLPTASLFGELFLAWLERYWIFFSKWLNEHNEFEWWILIMYSYFKQYVFDKPKIDNISQQNYDLIRFIQNKSEKFSLIFIQNFQIADGFFVRRVFLDRRYWIFLNRIEWFNSTIISSNKITENCTIQVIILKYNNFF